MGKSLDGIASEALVDGFVAYGWSRSSVLSTESALITKLNSHLTKKPAVELVQQTKGLLNFATTAGGDNLDPDPNVTVDLNSREFFPASASPSNYSCPASSETAFNFSPLSPRESMMWETDTNEHSTTWQSIEDLFPELLHPGPSTCNCASTSERGECSQTEVRDMSEGLEIEYSIVDPGVTDYFNGKPYCISYNGPRRPC
jgi:hypothetical protein